jgi:hypothetical protein
MKRPVKQLRNIQQKYKKVQIKMIHTKTGKQKYCPKYTIKIMKDKIQK